MENDLEKLVEFFMWCTVIFAITTALGLVHFVNNLTNVIIKSEKRLEPVPELVIKDGKVDTIFLYKIK